MQRPPINPALTAAALSFATRGWHVIPVTPGQKRPAVPGHTAATCPRTGPCTNGHLGWEERATTDPERIGRCWNYGGYWVGIATGPSGLVVLDLDTPKLNKPTPQEWQIPGVQSGEDVLAVLAERAGATYAELFDTHTVRTPSGGLHLYFQAPAGTELHNTTGELGWLIDTRAIGGQVVAAGELHDGRTYQAIHDAHPSPLPDWLAERLTETENAVAPADPRRALRIIRSGADRRTRYANTALSAEINAVLAAAKGTRNTTLHKAAFALGQLVGDGLLPEHVVDDALSAAGHAIGLPAKECAATIRSGIRAGIAHPRGGVA